MPLPQDTIAAIATALGEAGIGIIRISGPAARSIGEEVIRKRKGTPDFSPRLFQHGYFIKAGGEIIDEIMFVFIPEPHTFTGEDTLEIHAHGSIVTQKKILAEILAKGARLAEPGEFTKRAFLNKRMDLSQAEAVIDLIRAKSDAAAGAAIKQLEGVLAEKVASYEGCLYKIMARMEASIDFPEETDILISGYDEIRAEIKEIRQAINELLTTAGYGKILREGLALVIVGRPNVGKSSLLNYFLQEDRAIVTSIPGTTRDIIEENVNFEGIPLRLIDTAGLRETEDPIEKVGIKKTKQYIEQAEMVLFMLDSSEEITEEDLAIGRLLSGSLSIIVLNKTDLPIRTTKDKVRDLWPDKKTVEISLEKETGLAELKEVLLKTAGATAASQTTELIITNTRHTHLLKEVYHHLLEAEDSLAQKLPEDIVAVDLKEALLNLGLITGKTFTAELLDQIFSQFCIGK